MTSWLPLLVARTLPGPWMQAGLTCCNGFALSGPAAAGVSLINVAGPNAVVWSKNFLQKVRGLRGSL